MNTPTNNDLIQTRLVLINSNRRNLIVFGDFIFVQIEKDMRSLIKDVESHSHMNT